MEWRRIVVNKELWSIQTWWNNDCDDHTYLRECRSRSRRSWCQTCTRSMRSDCQAVKSFFLAKYIENDAKHEHALGRISRFTFSKLNQFTKYQRISIKGRYQAFPNITEDLKASRHLCQGSPVVIATNEAELWNHRLRIGATVKVPPVWVLWQMQSESY